MIQNIFGIRIQGGLTGLSGDDLFRISLNDAAGIEPGNYVDYYWNNAAIYARNYLPEEMFDPDSGDQNLIYDRYLSNRFHIPIKQLKYYPNISDIWYMNALYCGVQQGQTIFDQIKMRFVSLQSFANINLGVDSIILGLEEILPPGKTLEYDFVPASTPGIRLVLFVDKMELVDRKVGGKTFTNLQFHYTIKSYLIDPSLGGQYSDFTAGSLLSTKSFYFEQTIPTFTRDQFQPANSLKTGWGHFIYPATTNNYVNIKYVQLEDVLKVIYNSIFFSQNTNNISLQVDSSSLRNWINADITLRNALDDYIPDCITQNQAAPPVFGFTDAEVLENWLVEIKDEAVTRYGGTDPGINFILSYDNIYWEPLTDSYLDGIYSDSPSTFMTRLTSFYSPPGDTPIDEPGNFSAVGGYVKTRRKGFLAELFSRLIEKAKSIQLYNLTDGEAFANYLEEEYQERFMGSKFFPFYRFKQWKNIETQKELLDVITIPFSGSVTTTNIIECETSDDLKRVVSPYETLTPYRKKITTKPDLIPAECAATLSNPFPSTVQRINAIGVVYYYYSDGSIEKTDLNTNAVYNQRLFSFLTWPFANILLTIGYSQWTRNGRYALLPTNIEINSPNITNVFLGTIVGLNIAPISLCKTMTCGMYETTEEAYKKWKSIISDPPIYIYGDPSPTDPLWEDYYNCVETAEITEDVIEYCEPSPSPDGKEVVRRKGKQKYTVSSSGVKTPAGDPVWYEYPSTTFIENNATETRPNGTVIKGKRIIVYKDCDEVSNIFQPDSTSPTGPVGPSGGGVVTGGTGPIVTGPNTTGPTGPIGPSTPIKTGVNVAFEEFINPAIFKRNELVLSPSDKPIPIFADKAFYTLKFKYQDADEPSTRYVIKLAPGLKGQVLVLEINTFTPRHNGVILYDKSLLTNDKAAEKVYLSTSTWGDGGGQPFKSYLFLIFDGKNWVEFLRRDIY